MTSESEGAAESTDATYQGTSFDLVYASHPTDEGVEWALGIVDMVAGEEFGWYADCGIVHRGDYGAL